MPTRLLLPALVSPTSPLAHSPWPLLAPDTGPSEGRESALQALTAPGCLPVLGKLRDEIEKRDPPQAFPALGSLLRGGLGDTGALGVRITPHIRMAPRCHQVFTQG